MITGVVVGDVLWPVVESTHVRHEHVAPHGQWQHAGYPMVLLHVEVFEEVETTLGSEVGLVAMDESG